MSFKNSLFIISFLFLAGCSSNTPTPKKPAKINTQAPKQKELDLTPKWVYSPSDDRNICSIGSSKILRDKKMMNKIASMKAKANISKEISLYIETQSKTQKKSKSSSFTTTSSQQSTNMLKSVKIVNEFEDKKNDMFYLRACVQKI